MTPGVVRRGMPHQLPLLGWLVLVWVLLWGTWSWANVLSGLLVAGVVVVVLPLPAVAREARIRPLPLLVFLGRFLADLTVSSFQVAWQAVRPGGARTSAILVVQLRTDSDLLLAVITGALTLVPGSIVLDLDRERRTLALHVLLLRADADLDAQRASVLATEDRVVRAFGTAQDVTALTREPARPERPPGGAR